MMSIPERDRFALVGAERLDAAANELSAAGCKVLVGWSLPVEPWDLSHDQVVCVGRVDTTAEASAALLAAVRGAGLVIAIGDSSDAADTFLDDLCHLGSVDDRRSADRHCLGLDQRHLLELLATGHTLPTAAAALHLSLRTAERRLAAIRTALGVGSTAEAILAARRAGELRV
jgi:hypothetical protein